MRLRRRDGGMGPCPPPAPPTRVKTSPKRYRAQTLVARPRGLPGPPRPCVASPSPCLPAPGLHPHTHAHSVPSRAASASPRPRHGLPSALALLTSPSLAYASSMAALCPATPPLSCCGPRLALSPLPGLLGLSWTLPRSLLPLPGGTSKPSRPFHGPPTPPLGLPALLDTPWTLSAPSLTPFRTPEDLPDIPPPVPSPGPPVLPLPPNPLRTCSAMRNDTLGIACA